VPRRGVGPGLDPPLPLSGVGRARAAVSTSLADRRVEGGRLLRRRWCYCGHRLDNFKRQLSRKIISSHVPRALIDTICKVTSDHTATSRPRETSARRTKVRSGGARNKRFLLLSPPLSLASLKSTLNSLPLLVVIWFITPMGTSLVRPSHQKYTLS